MMMSTTPDLAQGTETELSKRGLYPRDLAQSSAQHSAEYWSTVGRNPVTKYKIQLEYRDEQADVRTGLPNPSREAKFSGANTDRKK